jgi:hypothetical protein
MKKGIKHQKTSAGTHGFKKISYGFEIKPSGFKTKPNGFEMKNVCF